MPGRLKQVRQVFLDMDGTIYHGGTLFPTTIPFLDFLKERGIGYAFLSNNSSFSTAEYVEKLCGMGIESGPENFYTSTCYTIDYLKRKCPEIRKLHLFGMPCIRPEFEAAGFELTDTEPQAVVVAFHRDFHYRDLCRRPGFCGRGCRAMRPIRTSSARPTSRPGCRTAARSRNVSKLRRM